MTDVTKTCSGYDLHTARIAFSTILALQSRHLRASPDTVLLRGIQVRIEAVLRTNQERLHILVKGCPVFQRMKTSQCPRPPTCSSQDLDAHALRSLL